jgi:hypothetical protein
MDSELVFKLRVGNYKYPVRIHRKQDRLWLHFAYNKSLLEEVKSMEGARWHGFEDPPIKAWSIKNSQRNWFQLRFLSGENVYERYDRPLIDFTPRRKKKEYPQLAYLWPPDYDPESPVAYKHQIDMMSHIWTRHYAILGAEMGTGKTLAAIEVMEVSNIPVWWWIGPKSALRAVELEFRFWKSRITPIFMTYERLVKVINSWEAGTPAPMAIVVDESSRAKNPTAQRSQAVLHIANAIREEHGEAGFVIEMSGSPAPKSPADWWHQAEIACPGFLKEGDINKLKNRLGIITTEESVTGGKFPKLVAWRDSDKKCDVCGLTKEAEVHDVEAIVGDSGDLYHPFKAAKNEVALLYERLKGLVYIVFKKDCLDLPQKIYKTIQCKVDKDLVNAAKLIALTARSTIEALTLTRELSDGFQYKTVYEKVPCPVCQGESKGTEGSICHGCHNEGTQKKEIRTLVEVPCPKDEEFLNLLDEHDEYRRFITYAGFTASIDRVYRLGEKAGWKVLRVDGRGWYGPQLGNDATNLLELFQSDSEERILFTGHPGSAGMGLTLTRSPSILYFSNDFNGESRIQSEDRIHRPGSRGANIFDLLNLPTDLLVLNNVKKKRELQSITMGEIQEAIINAEEERIF